MKFSLLVIHSVSKRHRECWR